MEKTIKKQSNIYSKKYYKSEEIKDVNDHFYNGANYMLQKIKDDIEEIKDIIGRKPKINEPDFVNDIWKIIDKY